MYVWFCPEILPKTVPCNYFTGMSVSLTMSQNNVYLFIYLFIYLIKFQIISHCTKQSNEYEVSLK